MPRFLFLLLAFASSVPFARGDDWPMWRHDAQRTARTPTDLPHDLHLQWVRELPKLEPAWKDQQHLMAFDAGYEPVVVGHSLYLASSRNDCVTAYDTRTGETKWRFYADGPVRFAPLVHEGTLYFVSDDGYLYALDADKGSLLWKVRGGPSDKKILGNERLVSMWPARGAPVIADGTVYFAAGIWPFMGIFLHAVDAKTGEIIWTNDGDGSTYMKQPHSTDSFAGVAPQGAMCVVGDRLLVPGGRSCPACYDRKTGKLLHYLLDANSKKGGGTLVASGDKLFVNGDGLFELEDGKYLGALGTLPVLSGDVLFTENKGTITAHHWKEATSGKFKFNLPTLGSVVVDDATAMIQAGTHLYLGCKDEVLRVALPLPAEGFSAAEPVWKTVIEGTPFSVVAADERLFVTTNEGRVYCFGEEKVETPKVIKLTSDKIAPTVREGVKSLEDSPPPSRSALLEFPQEGYAVVWGLGDGETLNRLLDATKLHVIGVEPDAAKARKFRDRLTESNHYGERVAVLVGDPKSVELPPYLLSLSLSADLDLTPEAIRKLFESLRPFGGAAIFSLPLAGREKFRSAVDALKLPNLVVRITDYGVRLTREGALVGSANWTHEHADATNCRVSKDQLVKAPLGLLWFGGPPHDGILPRHGHGPQPQVVDGRLVIEGVDKMRAIDIYTGRLLWETSLPAVGAAYDNLAHQPGANAGGSNYVSMPDGIYIAYVNSCVILDPVTGKVIRKIPLPGDGKKDHLRWGYLNVAGDYLLGGSDAAPEANSSKLIGVKFPRLGESDQIASSKELFALDRHTGKLLWSAPARFGFRHNAVCVGGGKLFAIDRLSGSQLLKLKKEGKSPTESARVCALDLKTGKEVWSWDEEVFGTWLSYSEKYDVLIESGRVARDTLNDEPKGMRAYRAANGTVMWFEKTYVGPAMLHGDTVFKDTTACDLLTGEAKLRPDPITGTAVPWNFARNYGCNTPLAAEHLLTFRSGAAGYCDLLNDSGTGNFGGFRSSCTNNLIVGGGLITAPDYTRTCTCSYQNQCSIALVPMNDAEMWTSYGKLEVTAPVKRVGINFGAPGDRKSEDGTLWLESPSVGGSSPNLDVHLAGKVTYFRRHSSTVTGPLPWVASSGAKGMESVGVTLGPKGSLERSYTVRLVFAEPEARKEGERLFDVTVQGELALDDFDILKEAGGPNRSVVKEIRGVKVRDELVLKFAICERSKLKQPLICGVEVVLEAK